MQNNILILTDDFKERLISDLKSEEFETERDVVEALQKKGYQTEVFGFYDNLKELADKIESSNPKCIFNLCESFRGERMLESQVASFLELLEVPFTGAKSLSLQLCKNKALTKRILGNHGYQVPKFASFLKTDSKSIAQEKWESISSNGKWIVKPMSLESSEGISLSSVVSSKNQAFERIHWLFEKVSEQVIVEEFIEGKELYVSVLALGGNRFVAHGPRELIFPTHFSPGSRIATYRTKWDERFKRQKGIYSSAFSAEDLWNPKVLDSSCKIAAELELTGYIRLDYRLHAQKGLFFLEANPNPGLASDDEFALAILESANITYEALVDSLVLQGLQKKRCFDFSSHREKRRFASL